MNKKGLTIPSFGSKIINKITVFGAAKSGIAILKKLHGHQLFLTESKRSIDPVTLNKLKQMKVPFELGGHTKKALDADLIVLSPGVPLDIPIIKKSKQMGIPVIGEIELAFYFLKKPIIAVTGTNGKTTTTALIGKMLKDSGFNVAVAGNIGRPLISVNDNALDYIVAEISSYQLEGTLKFKPWISIILNITEDHLTRHQTMANYTKQKAAIFKNQTTKDHLIYNMDDKRVMDIAKRATCRKVGISQKMAVHNGSFINNGYMFYKQQKICAVSDMRIKGAHNVENSLAASTAAMLCGVPPASIRRTLMSFKGVEHRIEFIKNKTGVAFYNDSKGTNPDSTIVAINALRPQHGLVLILGGRDKMTDLSALCRSVKQNVKEVVLVGEAKERFKKNLLSFGYKKIYCAKDFKEAVRGSFGLAHPGDAVLLSPACASFDMFKNFEERGKVFKQIVKDL